MFYIDILIHGVLFMIQFVCTVLEELANLIQQECNIVLSVVQTEVNTQP